MVGAQSSSFFISFHFVTSFFIAILHFCEQNRLETTLLRGKGMSHHAHAPTTWGFTVSVPFWSRFDSFLPRAVRASVRKTAPLRAALP